MVGDIAGVDDVLLRLLEALVLSPVLCGLSKVGGELPGLLVDFIP